MKRKVFTSENIEKSSAIVQGRKQEREGNAPRLLMWLYKGANIIGGCLFIKLLLKGALRKSNISESPTAAKRERAGVSGNALFAL